MPEPGPGSNTRIFLSIGAHQLYYWAQRGGANTRGKQRPIDLVVAMGRTGAGRGVIARKNTRLVILATNFLPEGGAETRTEACERRPIFREPQNK